MNPKISLFGAIFIAFLALPMLAKASCLDNATMQSNFTYNGALQTFVTPCDYGCDDTSGTCAPPGWIQDISIVAVIVFFVAALLLILRRRH